jgi:hypothetical protein
MHCQQKRSLPEHILGVFSPDEVDDNDGGPDDKLMKLR